MRKILILTPDGVGSTLLQRAACAWGNLSDTWINPHELTNGLVIKDGFLQKDWSIGYSQDLNTIIELLSSEKTNIISRLARYHIINRKDSEPEVNAFYRFLNSNFEIISCHRKNILEYSMSWAIRDIKKTLNVYSYKQKEKIHPAEDSFELDTQFIVKKLNDYVDYETWVSDNFPGSKQYFYEDTLFIDSFLLENVGGVEKDFKDRFGLSLGEFCLISNLSIAQLRELDDSMIRSVVSMRKYFHDLVLQGRMPNSVPLKMNSFSSKIRKTRNFDQVLVAYNQWTTTRNSYQKISEDQLKELINQDPFRNV